MLYMPHSLKADVTNVPGEDIMLFKQMSEPEHISVAQQVPANVREYASKYHVGMPLMLYPHSRFVRLSLTGYALFTAGLIGGTVYALKEYIDGIILDQTYPLRDIDPQEHLFQEALQALGWTTLILALYALLCTLLLWRYYRKSQQKLYICEEGLLRVGGKKEEAIRWDKVVDMSGSVDDKRMVLHGEGGRRRFVLAESWPGNKEFKRRIAYLVAERLLPQALERFENSIPLSFPPLLLLRVGIRHGRQIISWSDIEDAQDQNGQLALKTQGKWLRYMLIETPLIVGLVKHAMRSRLVATLAAHAWQEWSKTGE